MQFRITCFFLSLTFAVSAVGQKSFDEAALALSEEILADRPAPFKASPEWERIELAELGLRPDPQKDQYPLLNRILAETLRGRSNVCLVFKKGIYILHPPENGSYAFDLSEKTNWCIEGNGSELICTNPLAGIFNVARTVNVEVKDFHINYAPLPWTRGKVIGVDPSARTFDVKLEEGFPSLNESYFRKASRGWFRLLDREDPRLAKADSDTALFVVGDWKSIGPRVFRVPFGKKEYLKMIEVGDNFIQHARNMVKNAQFGMSKNVTFRRIQSSSGHGGFGGSYDENPAIIDCSIEIAEGRWIASLSDAIHFNRGKIGPWVENNTFEGICDDAMNVYNSHSIITESEDGRQLKLKNAPPLLKPGGKAWIFNQQSGELRGKFKVLAVDGKGPDKTVELDRGVDDLSTLKSTGRTGFQASGDDKIFFGDWSGTGAVIRNNTVKFANRHGIIIMTSHAIVEGNTIESCAGSGIKMGNHNRRIENVTEFANGFTLIRNNKILGGDQGATWKAHNSWGSIHLSLQRMDHKRSPWQGLTNVFVLDNKIGNYSRGGIYASNLSGGAIARNQILSNLPTFSLADPKSKFGILIENSSGVEVKVNIIKERRPHATAIEVRPSVSRE